MIGSETVSASSSYFIIVNIVRAESEDLATGYMCDPTTKSSLRILARPGIKIRLTRNFDKTRGFVNGAVGVVVESLRGNEVFTVRLQGLH